MTLRDTLLQLGYVLIAGGAIFVTWALLTGPMRRITRLGETDDATPEPEGDRRSGSKRARS